MKTLKEFPKFAFTLSILLFMMSSTAYGFEAWWQCSSRQGGDWSFGRAPSICLVDHMQTQNFVMTQYQPILFDDTDPRTSERRRYMTELNALAKEVAIYYLSKRKPAASQSEVNAFIRGLRTLMHQETVWSHYRSGSDTRVRYMRGDNGHGHGLMQVDDRSHQSALLQGKGADLIYNMMYGLDVFYDAWQRAPSQSCVSSSTHWVSRIRSAWAAYNGGPSRICRWVSTTGPFAHHDRDFKDKLDNEYWRQHLNSDSIETALNVNCLTEGTRPCPNTGTHPEPVVPQLGEMYTVGSGLYCVQGEQTWSCVEKLNDIHCMELRDQKNYPLRGTVDIADLNNKPLIRLDRNSLCQSSVKGLFELTQTVKLKKNINVRLTPGGERLGTFEQGSNMKIIDFEVTNSTPQDRYYKASFQNVTGYIYAGDKDDYLDWMEPVDDKGTNSSPVANIGDSIQITAPNGINLRKTPGGDFMSRVPNGEVLSVEDRVVQGSRSYLYYKVSWQGRTGYIYSGYLEDLRSLNSWTLKLPSVETASFSLNKDLQYNYLMDCPEEGCAPSLVTLRSDQASDQVTILKQQGRWVKVENIQKNKIGWILKDNLVETKR